MQQAEWNFIGEQMAKAHTAALLAEQEAFSRIKPEYMGTRWYGKSTMDGGLAWAVFKPWVPIEWIRHRFPTYNGGIGRLFSRPVRITRTRTRTLAVQFFGWDV